MGWNKSEGRKRFDHWREQKRIRERKEKDMNDTQTTEREAELLGEADMRRDQAEMDRIHDARESDLDHEASVIAAIERGEF